MPFCSQFIPMEVVTHPKHQSIIYHPSILPLHRGASAINWFVHYQLLRFLSASSQAFHSRFRVLNFQVYRIDLIVFSVLILSSDQITLWEFYITAFSLSHFQKPANQLRCCCHLWLDRIRSGWRIVTFKTCRRIPVNLARVVRQIKSTRDDTYLILHGYTYNDVLCILCIFLSDGELFGF